MHGTTDGTLRRDSLPRVRGVRPHCGTDGTLTHTPSVILPPVTISPRPKDGAFYDGSAGRNKSDTELLESGRLTLDELTKRSAEFNPIDNLAPLAKSGVKVFHIHGDSDTLREGSIQPTTLIHHNKD